MGAFFTEADMAALGGSWSWLAGQAMEQGNEGYLEDALASVQPWVHTSARLLRWA
jgi:hypothetical protein